MAPEWKKQAKAAATAARHQRRQQRNQPAAKKPPLTHFLCAPLVTPASRPVLARSVALFRDEAAKLGGVPTRAVRPVGSLHLTLGVMSLGAEGALEEAVAVLQACDVGTLLRAAAGAREEVQGGAEMGPVEPLVVTLESLHAMRAPRSTSSLYAAPRDRTQRLAPFCERVRGVFVDKGLMVDENRPLRLHATVINTIYARPGGRNSALAGAGAGNERASKNKDTSKTELGEGTAAPDANAAVEGQEEQNDGTEVTEQGDPGSEEERKTQNWKRRKAGPARFDASQLMEQFKDFEWAPDLKLDRIAICKMGAEKVFDSDGQIVDEVYNEIAVRELP